MRILVVDDEPLVRKSLSRACRSRGHEVIEAEDGAIGLSLWLSQSPDLVFLDVLMPGLSGPEVLQQIQAKRVPGGPRARVILMSAYSGEHNVATAQQVGADLFVPKPFENIFAVVDSGESLVSQKPS